jgi:hypothetical protein
MLIRDIARHLGKPDVPAGFVIDAVEDHARPKPAAILADA